MTRLFYGLPDVINPPDRICVQLQIPDEVGHRIAFMGAIKSLSHWYSWDRDEAKTGRLVAEVWREIYQELEDKIGSQSCTREGFPMLQQNPADKCQMQYLDENGVWVTFFDFGECPLFTGTLDTNGIINYSETNIANNTYISEQNIYNGNPSGYNPQAQINAQNAINRNKLLCFALRIYISTMLETISRNKEEAEANTITLAMVIGAGLALGFAPLTPLVVGAILASFSAGAIIGVATVSESELRDQIAQDAVICHMYNTLDNDNIGRATWAGVFSPNPFDNGTAEYKQVEALKNAILSTPSYLAFVNIMLTKLAFVDALSNECDLCGGGGVWEHTFDFTTSSHAGFWTNVTSHVPPFSLPELTAWVSGEGWGNGRLFDNSRQREQAYIIGVWDLRNITDFIIEYKLVAGGGGSFQFNNLQIAKKVITTYTTIRTVTPAGTSAGILTTNQNVGNTTMDGCRIDITGYQRAGNNNPNGATFIRKVTIKGTGDNPFV
jgi:hypothetical protein